MLAHGVPFGIGLLLVLGQISYRLSYSAFLFLRGCTLECDSATSPQKQNSSSPILILFEPVCFGNVPFETQ